MKKIVLIFTLFLATSLSAAQYEVHVTKGRLEAFPIAIPQLEGDSYANQVFEVLTADLRRSGIFRLLDQKSFIQTADSLRVGPRFGDWRLINAKALLTGNVRQQGSQIAVTYKLYDVYAEREIDSFTKMFPVSKYRSAAHTIADRVYERLIGIPGYFNTQILYVAESGPAKKRLKQLAIMDQDGFNPRTLTNPHLGMAITPRFCPTRPEATFMAYRNNRAQVCLIDLNTGQERSLGNFKNMTFAPRYSPDGQNLLMSYSEHGNSDVYVMNLASKKVVRLTANNAINTSPCFSPDARNIVFNSDRGGSQQLYVMNAHGADQKRISFGQGSYATPVWSPKGDLIAFTKILGGQFYIGIMRPDGSGERILTKGDYLVEGPEWAPNGRLLTYYRQARRGANGQAPANLYTIHVSGDHEQWLRTASDASDPSWSPLRID